MIHFYQTDVTCPDCGDRNVAMGSKDEGSSEKFYFECSPDPSESCGFTRVIWVSYGDVEEGESPDEVAKRRFIKYHV